MWKKGQKLVCIFDAYPNPFFTGIAKKGDIYTYEGPKPGSPEWILLAEDQTRGILGDRTGYDPSWFRPLLGDSAISELTSFEPVKETSDLPIQIPQTA